MRTLKKSLCLVLALVFVLGLCTIGAGAAATELKDAASIGDVYKDAVVVMNGLGIIEGYPDGTFQPTKNVTRAEAAKLVTYMVLGEKNAERVPDGDGGFSDVAGNWASKYINYCSSKGYIKGMGDGTFNPSGNITGTQLAALLLRAAGYGVMGEYEGKGWDINAVSDALYYGVFGDTEAEDFGAPATREETVLYFFNTLKDIIRVAYDVDLNDYVTNGINAGTTFGSAVWKLVTDKFVQVVDNQAAGAKYTVIDRDGVLTTTRDQINLKLDTGKGLLAHEVTAYYKGEAKTDANGTEYYDAYLVDDKTTVVNKGSYYADLYTALFTANKANASVGFRRADIQFWDNSVYNVSGSTTIWDWNKSNMATFSFVALNDGTDSFTKVSDLKDQKASNSTMFLSGDLLLNHEGKFYALVSSSYSIAKVKAIAADGTITLTNNPYGSATYSTDYAYEGIAVNDYVTVQPVGSVYMLEKNSESETTIFDVSKGIFAGYYNFLGIGASRAKTDNSGITDKGTINVGAKVKFYNDSHGGYYAYEVLESGTDAGAVFVVKTYTKSGDYGTAAHWIQGVDQNGKEVNYQVYSVDGTKQSTSATALASANSVYKVNESSNGAILKSEGVTVTRSDASKSMTAGGKTYFVSPDTKVLYVDGSAYDLEVVKSNALKSGASTPYVIYLYATENNDTTWDIKTIWTTSAAPSTPDSSGSYFYVPAGTAASGEMDADGDGDADSYYSFYLDGESQSAIFVADPSTVVEGFFRYSKEEFTNASIYTLFQMPTTGSGTKQITVALSKNDLHNGILYIASASGVGIQGNKLVNVSRVLDSAKKDYLTFSSLADIEAHLASSSTASVTITYLANRNSAGNWVPTGTIYVTTATN